MTYSYTPDSRQRILMANVYLAVTRPIRIGTVANAFGRRVHFLVRLTPGLARRGNPFGELEFSHNPLFS